MRPIVTQGQLKSFIFTLPRFGNEAMPQAIPHKSAGYSAKEKLFKKINKST